MTEAALDFAELNALADREPHGRMWLCEADRVWNCAACPLASAAGAQSPIEAVPDTCVQTALKAEAWIVAAIDDHARSVHILAVQKAPAAGEPARVLQAARLGIADAA